MKKREIVSRGRLVLLSAALLLVSFPGFSQDGSTETVAPEVRVLDVNSALQLALESNLGIQSQELTVAQKKLIRDSWWNRFYPSVSARATLGRMNKEQTTSGLVPFGAPGASGAYEQVLPFEQELPRWNLSTALDMSLTLTPALSPGISLAGIDLGASRIELQKQLAQVERDVQKSFYDILITQEQLGLLRDQISAAERRLEQTQLNYDAGLVDEFTLLSARVNVANLRPQLRQLENGYQQAMMAFKMQIGVDLDDQVRLSGSIDAPAGVEELRESLGSITDEMLYGRYDVQGLEQQRAVLEEQRRLAVYQSLPSLTLGWTVDPAFQGDPWEDELTDGDRWEQRSGMFSITVRQPIDPWFPRSQTRNEMKGYERQLVQNQLNTSQALTGAQIEVRSLINGIESSLESVEALELNVELAQRAYELAEQAYNSGLRDLTEVEQAEVDLQDARFQLIQERKRIIGSLLDLEYALNTSMEEILR